MESYAEKIGAYDGIEKNTAVIIYLNNRSFNNGKNWTEVKTVNIIEQSEIFTGERIEDGPSLGGGFWGNCNEIRSGRNVKYYSKFNGNRWISLKNK